MAGDSAICPQPLPEGVAAPGLATFLYRERPDWRPGQPPPRSPPDSSSLPSDTTVGPTLGGSGLDMVTDSRFRVMPEAPHAGPRLCPAPPGGILTWGCAVMKSL